ncbi:MAG TPA: GntR family transcriptional regulator, partial [Pseudolysinimonas sp.]|nr:GntR family transcriptional regulator [Pseudolysinimonas sp.]
MSEEWKAAQRREFSVSKILDLGQHRRQDEARRLRDLLARFIVPSLGPSRRIPSEEEIARQFHCSRNTARTALRMLAQEHMIERVVGVGTHGLKDPSIWRSDRMVDTF